MHRTISRGKIKGTPGSLLPKGACDREKVLFMSFKINHTPKMIYKLYLGNKRMRLNI